MKKIPQFNAHLDKDSYSKEEVEEIINTFNKELPHVIDMCTTAGEDTFFAKFVSYISLITTLLLLLFK